MLLCVLTYAHNVYTKGRNVRVCVAFVVYVQTTGYYAQVGAKAKCVVFFLVGKEIIASVSEG